MRWNTFIRGIMAAGLCLALLSSGPAHAATTISVQGPSSLPDFNKPFSFKVSVKYNYDLASDVSPTGKMLDPACISATDPSGMALFTPAFDNGLYHAVIGYDFNWQRPGDFVHYPRYGFFPLPWSAYVTTNAPSGSFTDTIKDSQIFLEWNNTIKYYVQNVYGETCQRNGTYDSRYEHMRYGNIVATADYKFKAGTPPPPRPPQSNSDFGQELPGTDTEQGALHGPDANKACPFKKAQVTADPIYLATGDNELVEHDVTIGSGPMALSVTRTYHSQSRHDGHIGYGWTWSYGWSLDPSSWYQVRIRRPDGKLMTFNEDDSGTYWRQLERFDETVVKTPYGWRYTSHDRSSVDFDDAGHLLAVHAEDGQSITMAYDPSSGFPVSVTGPHGRKLLIGTDTQGHITSITGPMGRTWSYTYNKYYGLASVTYPDGNTRHYLYEDDRRDLTGIVDAAGRHYATFAYDYLGRAVLSDDPLTGNRYSVAYNPDDTVTVTEPDGAQRTYTKETVNGTPSIVSVSDPSCSCGTANSFTLDDKTGMMTASSNPAGVTNHYSYDDYGRLLTETQAVGTALQRTLSYSYDAAGHLLSSTDAMGNVTRYAYDDRGHRISETDALGHVTRWSYNLDGTVATKTDPDGGVTRYGYDPSGDLTSVTAPDGSVRYMAYDAAGRMILSIDAMGATTHYAYDARDRLLSTTYADGSRVTNSYDAVGDLASTTDAAGLVTTYTYDADHHPLTVTRPDGTALNMTYDGKGNLVRREVLDAQGTVVASDAMSYDADNRLLTTTHADGNKVTDSYDETGNLLTVTDEAGRVTTNAYDVLGRMTATTNPNEETVRYAYDALDRRTQVTAANGAATGFSYDAGGELTNEASPDRGNTIYTYDAAGNVASKTDGNGVVSNDQYDAMHRLTGVTYPSDSSLDVSLTYDADGRLTQMTDASGVTTYTYDVMGRTTDVDWTPKGADDAVHVGYAYDDAGRLASMTYPSGRVVSYQYDSDGRIDELDATVDGSNQTLVSGIAYSPLGGVASRSLGNGITETRSFDARGRLTAIDAGDVLQRTLSWSPQSTITSISDGVNPSASQTFNYDAADRLTGASGLYGNLAYTYDANGNRMSKADADGTAAYGYQPNTNRLSSAGSVTYDRDTAGNRLSDGRFTYIYGANNRLASVSKLDDDHGRPDVLASYVYNGRGQRVIKRLGREGEQATWYVYDLSGNLIAELNGRGRVTAEYVYGPTGRLATIAVRGEDGKGGGNHRRHGGDDSSESVYWHINDHLGTPQALTDRRGRVVWAADYTPFGNIVSPRHGDEDHGEGRHWKVTNNFRFPGQYFDAETELNYNYHRTYDPAIGRYTQSDPIGFNGGMNIFGYVLSDPVNWVDILGLASLKTGGNRITVHKHDADPWPSDPHGHIYDKNQVVDTQGNIYDKSTGLKVGQLTKKQVTSWTKFLRRIGKLGIIGDYLWLKDWTDNVCAIADPGNPFCNPQPTQCTDI